MNSVFDFDVLVTYRRSQFLAEAESERLARLASLGEHWSVRTRLALALYALADRLAPPDATPMLDTHASA